MKNREKPGKGGQTSKAQGSGKIGNTGMGGKAKNSTRDGMEDKAKNSNRTGMEDKVKNSSRTDSKKLKTIPRNFLEAANQKASRRRKEDTVIYDRYREEEYRNATVIVGRNAVTELLKSGHPVDRLLIQEGAEGSIVKIFALAKEKNIPLRRVTKEALNRIAEGSAHQGVIAYGAPHQYAEVEDILALAKERKEDPLVVLLDGITDPHNLGAILRSCECVGAHGVIIPKHGSVGLTQPVAKTAAGALEYVPCARVANLSQTIQALKDKGLWVAACDMGGQTYYEADLKGPLAIVIGSEGKGLSRLVKENCDFTVSIPINGHIDSLNASNAAAIILYEALRRRG